GASWVGRDGVRTVHAPSVDLVDATGAGDAFDAGLLAAWLTGADPESARRASRTPGVTSCSSSVTGPSTTEPSTTGPSNVSCPESITGCARASSDRRSAWY